MADCEYCNQDMKRPCKVDKLRLDGKVYDREVHEGTEQCGNCKTPEGGFHHPGCDFEMCPKCREQLIGCNCVDVNLITSK